MTHIIIICIDQGVVVQINYVAKEIAFYRSVIGLLKCVNDESPYD